MDSFGLTASGLTLEIQHRYKAMNRFCEGYRVELPLSSETEAAAGPEAIRPDAVISVTDEELEAERRRAEAIGRSFSMGYYEITAIFRKIAEFLPRTGRFLMHGSALAMDGEGYMFTAPSGTGKSTHASFWRKAFGQHVVMVNDDKPFIRIDADSGKAFVSGNPWNGKHRLGCNAEFPLKALCVLTRGAENIVKPLSREEAFPILLRQVYRPSDPGMLAATLDLLEAFERGVKLYTMSCNLDPDAARTAYEGMRD